MNRCSVLIQLQVLGLFVLLSLYSLTLYAAEYASVEFFLSNNTEVLQINEAYLRLIDKSQDELQEQTITILQKNHIEQGTLKPALGMYHILSEEIVSADNAERFISSSQQFLSEAKIINLSSELAKELDQESVAVFIPNNDFPLSDTTLYFTNTQPTVLEALSLLQHKLPLKYSQAFSMYLEKQCANFDTIKVVAIEWLGQQVDVDLIRQTFPQDVIYSRHGEAYLVYKDGSKKWL